MRPTIESFNGLRGWTGNSATQLILDRVHSEDIITDIDWDEAFARFGSPEMPEYVRAPIHGVPDGFANPSHAAGWDAIVHELLEEYGGGEDSVRTAMPALITEPPGDILDVGCGTGTCTLPWHTRFPEARIVGVDVSPYMLAVAERRFAATPNVEVLWGNAEILPFDDASFDVVTATFLFHELPKEVSPQVLREMRRVVRPSGQVAILEPYTQRARILRPLPFPEPFLKDYLSTNWDDALIEAGFGDVSALESDEGWVRIATAA